VPDGCAGTLRAAFRQGKVFFFEKKNPGGPATALVGQPSSNVTFATSAISQLLASGTAFATSTADSAVLAPFNSYQNLSTLSAAKTNLFIGDQNGALFSAPYSALGH